MIGNLPGVDPTDPRLKDLGKDNDAAKKSKDGKK